MKTVVHANRTYKPLLLGLVLFAALAAAWALWPNHTSTVEAVPPLCVPTTPSPCQALLLLPTVTGGMASIEATTAAADGFTVTGLATFTGFPATGGATGAGAVDSFDDFRVIIFGDPTCGPLNANVLATAPIWAPVVMGTTPARLPGNRIVIGTDPVYHFFGTGANILIADGIAFAGALPGRTGVYFNPSCGSLGDAVPILNMLSSGGTGTWTENTSPPCGGSVSLVATNAYFDGSAPGAPPALATSHLAGWGCSVHESFPTFNSGWIPLAIATDTATVPFCGSEIPGGAPVCGQPYILVAGVGISATAPNISVSPLTDTNPPGTSHTVTATVTTTAGAPVVGQLVSFTVTGQNNGAVGTCVPASCMTNAAGQVTFTYTDTVGCGDDTILASFTDAGTGTVQQASASKTWTCETPTPTPVPPPGPPVVGGIAGLLDSGDQAPAAASTSGDGSRLPLAAVLGLLGALALAGPALYLRRVISHN